MSYPCDTCDRHFASRRGAEQHMRTRGHHAPDFRCDTCPGLFYSETAVRQHMDALRHHAPVYTCESCDKRFKSEKAAHAHMTSKGHYPPEQCDVCDRQFKTLRAAVSHMDAFKHHSCSTCDRRFASGGAACQHMDNFHHWLSSSSSGTSYSKQDSKKPVVNGAPEAVAQPVNKQPISTRPVQHPADPSFLKEIPIVKLPVPKLTVAKQPVQKNSVEELPVAKQLINTQTVQHPAHLFALEGYPIVRLPRTELPIAKFPVEEHSEDNFAVRNRVAEHFLSQQKSAEKQVVETHPASEKDQHKSDDSIFSGIRVASGQQCTLDPQYAEFEFDCPHCDDNFLKASGVIDHLECGECVSEAFRYESLYEFLAAVDSDCVFTNAQMDEVPETKQYRHGESDTWGLPNQGTEFSVRHQQTLYHCPDTLDCNMGFNTLAAVFRHLENEECGHMEYENVQGKMRKILGVFSACNGR